MTAAPAPPSRSTETYRYLRLSIVLLTLLLAASVAIEAWWGQGDGSAPGSISAYYYTPVRGVFIGTLVAMGLGLIAIHGRDWGYEDVLLNLSGMLATVVAFVPTPVLNSSALPCPPGFKEDAKCVPLEYRDDVGNNVWALLVLAVLGLIVAGLFTRPSRADGPKHKQWVIGYRVAVVVVVVAGYFFIWEREFFLRWAHYAAAIPTFGLLVVVGVVNGLSSDRTRTEGRKPPDVPGVTAHLKQWYFGLALAMFGTVVAALFYAFMSGESRSDTWLFWVEVFLLFLFSVFWILQTIDFWNEGLPPADGHPARSDNPGTGVRPSVRDASDKRRARPGRTLRSR